MREIGRGCTPIIPFTFKRIDPNDFEEAYLTITQNGTVKIEKNIDDAEIGENSIAWNLTQAETLSLAANVMCEIQIRYKTEDGFAGKSPIYTTEAEKLLKEGEI